ncbi:hypothetical protein EDC04DRAFT_2500756, partial [Pisolithus marmoratus]
TPRLVRGCGTSKVGLCQVRVESPTRGGRGQCVWLSMEFSACNYHMRIGMVRISALSSTPFSPPTMKQCNPAKRERTHILEGKCHKCKKWILAESLKDSGINVFWQHAAACHQGIQIEDDDDVYKKFRNL